MVSGYTEESRIIRALDAGVHTYVLKPVTPKSLAERLAQVIERPPQFIRTAEYFGPYRPSRLGRIGAAGTDTLPAPPGR